MPAAIRRLLPRVEILEERLVPTNFIWIGGKNADWENPANWQRSDDNHLFPHNTKDVQDSVTLNAQATTALPLTVKDITIDNLTITSGFTRTLNLSKNLTVANMFSQQGGTVTGAGKLVVADQGEILVAVIGANATKISYDKANLSVVGTLTIASTTDIKNTQFVLFKDSTITVEKTTTTKDGKEVPKYGNLKIDNRYNGGIRLNDSKIDNNGKLDFGGSVVVQVTGTGTINNNAVQGAQVTVAPLLGESTDTKIFAVFNNLSAPGEVDDSTKAGVFVQGNSTLTLERGGTSSGSWFIAGKGEGEVPGKLVFTSDKNRETYKWRGGTTFASPSKDNGEVVLGTGSLGANVDIAQSKILLNSVNFTFASGQKIEGQKSELQFNFGATFTWKAGDIEGTKISVISTSFTAIGDHTLADKSELSIGRGASATLQKSKLTLKDSIITNGGEFTFTDDSSIVGNNIVAGQNNTFTNSNQVIMNGEGKTATINVPFVNFAVVNIQKGTLKIPQFSQPKFQGMPNDSQTILAGGTLDVSGKNGKLDMDAGFLQTTPDGSGTIIGDVNNTGGTVDPGGRDPKNATTHFAGTITIQGTYTQGANGTLVIDLLGPVDGQPQKQDLLVVSGQIKLAGNLQINAPNNPQGDSFTLVQNTGKKAVNGTFVGFTEGKNDVAVGKNNYTFTYKGGSTKNSVVLNLVKKQGKIDTETDAFASINPTAFQQSVTFTATVTPNSGTDLPTGNVIFLDNGNAIGTGTLTVDQNTGLDQASISTSSLTVGGHMITAEYLGDGNFNASTSAPLSQTVNQAATAVEVVSFSNPSIYGQSGTLGLGFNVLAPGNGAPVAPTGTITLTDSVNGAAPTTLAVVSVGQSLPALPPLAAGTNALVATYGGDGNFLPSTSDPLVQIVNAASTTTALGSSSNPSFIGNSVTFTATVSAVAPGAGTPTGMVAFFVNGNNVDTESLSGGTASFTTSSLSFGSNTITAVYTPDTATFSGSTGGPLDQEVTGFSSSGPLFAAKSTLKASTSKPLVSSPDSTLLASLAPQKSNRAAAWQLFWLNGSV